MSEASIEVGIDGETTCPASTPRGPANGTPTPLARLTALLGEDVFFVPCEWGIRSHW